MKPKLRKVDKMSGKIDNITELRKQSGRPEMDGFMPFNCQQCESTHFEQVFLMLRKSAILTSSGQEEFAPIPAFACKTCGWVIGSPVDQEAKDIFKKAMQQNREKFEEVKTDLTGSSVSIE